MTDESGSSPSKRPLLAMLAITAVVVAALAGTWVVTSLAAPPRACAAKTTPACTPPPVEPADREPSGRAAAYALAIRTLADEIGKPAAKWPVLYIRDHACTSTTEAPGAGRCDGEPIPAQLRKDVTAALRDYAPVKFVTTEEELFDDELQIRDGGAIVTLGTATFDGAAAQVPVGIVGSGGLNAQGLTYRLAQENGAWRITGTTGPAWIA